MTEIRLQDYSQGFFEFLEEEYRDNTAKNYKCQVLKLIEYFQETGETLSLKSDKINKSSDKIREFYQHTGVHNVKTNAVRRFLEYIGTQMKSQEQKNIKLISEMVKFSNVSPTSTKSELTKEEVEPMILDQDEFDSALENADMKQYLILSLLMDTGCRASELAATQPSDYDFNPGKKDVDCVLQITKTYIQGKGVQNKPKRQDSRRAVEITEESKEILKDYIEMNDIERNELIFGNYQAIYHAVKDAFKEANVRTFKDENGDLKTRVSPHWIRHNKATQLVKEDNGLDLEDIRIYIGHSNLKSLRVYTHFDESDVIGVHN